MYVPTQGERYAGYLSLQNGTIDQDFEQVKTPNAPEPNCMLAIAVKTIGSSKSPIICSMKVVLEDQEHHKLIEQLLSGPLTSAQASAASGSPCPGAPGCYSIHLTHSQTTDSSPARPRSVLLSRISPSVMFTWFSLLTWKYAVNG